MFDVNCDCKGWFPWNNGDIVDIGGEYLGTIYQDNRICRFIDRDKTFPGFPGLPAFPGFPGAPESQVDAELHDNSEDINLDDYETW